MMAHEPIRVVVADDHEMMRSGLGVFFQAYSDLELIAEATNGEEAIELCSRLQPDVLLIELGLEQPDSLAAIRKVQGLCPGTSVIVLANLAEASLVDAVMEAGIFCCLLKDVPIEVLATAIREAYACASWWNDEGGV